MLARPSSSCADWRCAMDAPLPPTASSNGEDSRAFSRLPSSSGPVLRAGRLVMIRLKG